MRELFIYYQLRSENTGAAVDAVCSFQAKLREQHPQLIARLLRGAEATGKNRTWMETYSTDPAKDALGVDAELQSRIELSARGLTPFIDGSRHTEVFDSCAS